MIHLAIAMAWVVAHARDRRPIVRADLLRLLVVREEQLLRDREVSLRNTEGEVSMKRVKYTVGEIGLDEGMTDVPRYTMTDVARHVARELTDGIHKTARSAVRDQIATRVDSKDLHGLQDPVCNKTEDE